jgi:hypothetical protein
MTAADDNDVVVLSEFHLIGYERRKPAQTQDM